jgi:hypothetical protein
MINIFTLFHYINLALVPYFITKLIFYFNFVIWMIPPFRQHKYGFFLFFLINAITDPAGYLIYYIFHINPISCYALFSFLAFISILYYTNSLKTWLIIFNTIILLVGVALFFVYKDIRIIISLSAWFQINLIFTIIIYMAKKFFLRNILYSYFLIFILYEFTFIIKSFIFIFNTKGAIPFIYMLNIMEVFICIYFIVYNIKTSPKIRPKLTN